MRTLPQYFSEKLIINKNFKKITGDGDYEYPNPNNVKELDKMIINTLDSYMSDKYYLAYKHDNKSNEDMNNIEWYNLEHKIGGMDITNKNYDRIIELLKYVMSEVYDYDFTLYIIKESFDSSNIIKKIGNDAFELFDKSYTKKRLGSSFKYYIGNNISYFQYRRNGGWSDYDIVIVNNN